MKSAGKPLAALALTTLLTAWHPAGAAAWTAPIGIPVPPFGISEIAPAAPDPWNADNTTSGGRQFYYVCPSCAGSTDSANTYGYPSKPRATIPGTLPAGSVVEVHGQIDTSQSFTSEGTASNPVFVRGADYASRPKLTAGQGISGSYVILENIWWGPLDSVDNDFGVGMYEGSHHIAIRNCEASGNLNRAGGFGLGSWGYSGTQSLSYVVINNCNIHDIGDVNATTDQDSHGITVNGSVDHLWVTYNEISYTSGDAMQVEAQQGRNDKIHHVYYGKNHTHHNKQTGGAVKHATDVIFSQNVIHDHRPSNSSQGACTNTLYGPEYMWFLFNEVYDCNIGIGLFGNDGTAGQYTYVIGNIIRNIHATNPNDPYNAGAIVGYGGVNVYYINNTIYDVDAGFNLPPGWASVHLYNNIVANRTNTLTHDVYIESDPTNLFIQNNIFPPSPRFYWGGTVYTSISALLSGTGKGQNSLAADPQFTNPAGNNFTLQPTSPAKDSGAAHAAYTTFFARYGIDISKDFTGAARPMGTGWDMGAHEFGAPSPAPTLTLTATPTTVSASESSTLTWSSTHATSCTASGAWTGGKPPSGSESTGVLAATSTFTLTCTGDGGFASQSVTITRLPTDAHHMQLDLTASPMRVAPGGQTTLTWSSTLATACTATDGWGGAKPTAGSETLGPLTDTTYTLICTGPEGSVRQSVTVTVTAPPIVTMPLPSQPTAFGCADAGLSIVVSPDPAYARPLSVVQVSGDVRLQFGVTAFTAAVDIYVAVQLPNGSFALLSPAQQWVASVAPYRVDSAFALGPDTLWQSPLAGIPPGTYAVYTVIVAAGTDPASFNLASSSYYLWCAVKTFP